MPAVNELINWNTIITEVGLGNFQWVGAAHAASLQIPNWLQFYTYVKVKNTADYVSTRVPNYDQLIIARALPPIEVPTGATFVNGGAGVGNASWTNASAVLGIKVQYYNNGTAFGAVVTLAANTVSDSKAGYVVTDSGYFEVWYYNADGNGPIATSNTVAF